MKTTLLSLAAIATSTTLALAETPVTGQPVTMETLVNQAEVIRITNAIDNAVDAKDWDLARSFFADTIDVDFTSLIGGEPANIPSDALIAGWSGNLTAEKESFHLRGNHQVTFPSAETAMVYSHGYAWNRMESGLAQENGGEALWEVWGTYEHGLARTEDGWQVTSMTFTATAERGNDYVRNTPGG